MPPGDITKPVDLSLHAEGTGPSRQRRPVYVDFMPPCNSACPAGENIQAWMAFAQAGNYFEAFQCIAEENPFPAVMGRICVKPCETGCNRNHIDNTVNIHAVERFIGDMAIKEKWPIQYAMPSTGKKIMIVGGGPAGLSAAYHLARMGHQPEIFESHHSMGGLMHTGIPEYRLPKDILDFEIDRIQRAGVIFHVNHPVDDILKLKEEGKFDAVFLAVGAQQIKKEEFNNDNSIIVKDAFTFFNEVSLTPKDYVGKKIAVYGGGKLALYLARMIRRFKSEAVVFFPGDKKQMPAYDYETEDALAEGVQVELLKRIAGIENKTILLEKMKIEKSKPAGTNEFENMEADILIVANRQESGTSFLKNLEDIRLNEDGTININASRMTGYDGVFAGGDMLAGENRSATIAIGQGKKAAKYIDSYIRKQPFIKAAKHPTAGYRKLHMWYQTEAPQKEEGKLSPHVAIKSFDEIVAALTEAEARFEAQRCLSCGNCFECDGCYGACPEKAIVKLGKGNRYKFNYNACTGCAVCYEQCPCHAIEMIPEPVNSSNNGN
jgi:NADPH-dependent glutamate synthase beta subunit-like oxidoreductase